MKMIGENSSENKIINLFAENIVKKHSGCYLDSNNILWKNIGDKWIGKRSVYTYDFKASWLEDAKPENIRSWWCGKDENYQETFTND